MSASVKQQVKVSVPKNRLRQARLDAGFRLIDAAQALGISDAHLNRIESGKIRCPVNIFLAMVLTYKVKRVFDLAEVEKNPATT